MFEVLGKGVLMCCQITVIIGTNVSVKILMMFTEILRNVFTVMVNFVSVMVNLTLIHFVPREVVLPR